LGKKTTKIAGMGNITVKFLSHHARNRQWADSFQKKHLIREKKKGNGGKKAVTESNVPKGRTYSVEGALFKTGLKAEENSTSVSRAVQGGGCPEVIPRNFSRDAKKNSSSEEGKPKIKTRVTKKYAKGKGPRKRK